jgi:hypothetical protein
MNGRVARRIRDIVCETAPKSLMELDEATIRRRLKKVYKMAKKQYKESRANGKLVLDVNKISKVINSIEE